MIACSNRLSGKGPLSRHRMLCKYILKIHLKYHSILAKYKRRTRFSRKKKKKILGNGTTQPHIGNQKQNRKKKKNPTSRPRMTVPSTWTRKAKEESSRAYTMERIDKELITLVKGRLCIPKESFWRLKAVSTQNRS